jgi:hypothetical protein
MTDEYNPERDFAESLKIGYAAIRARESAKPESARSYDFTKREFVPPDTTGEDHDHRV